MSQASCAHRSKGRIETGRELTMLEFEFFYLLSQILCNVAVVSKIRLGAHCFIQDSHDFVENRFITSIAACFKFLQSLFLHTIIKGLFR